uniref:RBR-type E3 ubiquitin transferase n=1 Tax=Latimeria chalumnae TaxID=7897 RepID=H2ZWS0_LATCH
EASCGHMVEATGLKTWWEKTLEKGHFTFNCPKCAKEWAWQEMRKLTQITQGEMPWFECKIEQLTKGWHDDYKKCPECCLYVQRIDSENLCMPCLPCSEKKKVYKFCWACLREWQGDAPCMDCCDNPMCIATATLLSCPVIAEGHGRLSGCPMFRACPNCETLIQHMLTHCINMTCPNCANYFCFRCLKTPCYGTCCVEKRQKLTGKKN